MIEKNVLYYKNIFHTTYRSEKNVGNIEERKKTKEKEEQRRETDFILTLLAL